MKIEHARTGLKLEKRLYLRAQQQASDTSRSFAGYVIDLIASDLIGRPDTELIPDVKRLTELMRRAFTTDPISSGTPALQNLNPMNPRGRIRPPIDDGRIKDISVNEPPAKYSGKK